jgi:hypothetical protein
MTNCDFNRPCDCSDCIEKRHNNIKKCEYCNDINIYKIIDELPYMNRKGNIGDYYSFGICKTCLDTKEL